MADEEVSETVEAEGLSIDEATRDDSVSGGELVPVSDAGSPKSMSVAQIKDFVISQIAGLSAASSVSLDNDKEKWAKALDKTIFPGLQGGPLMHVIAAKAVAFKEALEPSFKEYQQQILDNAQALAAGLKERGFRLITDGTDNHLMLVDVRNKKVTGKIAEKALDKAGITANKNTIPNDPESPFVTSGLRLGTPAVTTRGMKTSEMSKIAEFIDRALTAPDDEANLAQIKKEVVELCNKFPFYK